MPTPDKLQILIIEDDPNIALAMYRVLRPLYKADIANSAGTALRKIRQFDYGAFLLDLRLPDMDGIEVCRQLREQSNAPILIVTGQAKVTEKVLLLDAGADDYITKPFSIEELKARLRAAIRRNQVSPVQNKLVVGDLMLDIEKHIVKRAGQSITLRRKEFSLLECLMTNAGLVVTRNILTAYAWGENHDIWTNAIDVHIKYLRDKVDRPFGTPLIKTVHGLGYKIDASNVAKTLTNKEGSYERTIASRLD